MVVVAAVGTAAAVAAAAAAVVVVVVAGCAATGSVLAPEMGGMDGQDPHEEMRTCQAHPSSDLQFVITHSYIPSL